MYMQTIEHDRDLITLIIYLLCSSLQLVILHTWRQISPESAQFPDGYILDSFSPLWRVGVGFFRPVQSVFPNLEDL